MHRRWIEADSRRPLRDPWTRMLRKGRASFKIDFRTCAKDPLLPDTAVILSWETEAETKISAAEKVTADSWEMAAEVPKKILKEPKESRDRENYRE